MKSLTPTTPNPHFQSQFGQIKPLSPESASSISQAIDKFIKENPKQIPQYKKPRPNNAKVIPADTPGGIYFFRNHNIPTTSPKSPAKKPKKSTLSVRKRKNAGTNRS